MPSLVHSAPATFSDFQAEAKRHGTVLALPNYPLTPDAASAAGVAAIKEADDALTKLAAQPAAALTFGNTFAAYDLITDKVGTLSAHLGTLAETHPDKTMRDACRDESQKLDAWGIGLDYREDVFRTLKAFADTHPKLNPEQQRLLDFTMRGYRRAGLTLPPAERERVEKLRQDLSELEQQFQVNINEARGPLDFTAAELAGVPESFLGSPGVKQPDGNYRVMANITFHAIAIAENADNAETRRRVYLARNQLAREKNVAVLSKLVALRADIAHRLGYAGWADYRTETRMAKTGATATKFEEELVTGLQKKFDAELEELRQMKAAATGQLDAKLDPWDINYYQNQLKKQKYSVDTEVLRVYFPYDKTLQGMFSIYERIFGLKFTEVEAPYTWAPGVKLFVVEDSATKVPMGAFFLDMFPRDGKYNHFANFPQKGGRVLPDGTYDLPLAALVCNFPPPSADKPSLLSHSDVETLFHEFGHVMHNILSRAPFPSQTSNGVPRDFVEAPSQMLENWVWDKAVLDTFAADYRDPSKKIPAATIDAMVRAREATEGLFYRRQLALGLIDLSMHSLSADDAWTVDVVAQSNAVAARVSIAPPANTAFVAYFGHLAGYDAGYYGYLWAKVMAIDMASVFKHAPDGFLDVKVGRRLRDEVYGMGDRRDVGDSVEKFLGRPRSMEPFLEYVGLKK
ncbi:MAG TPA: M3 family metallopeptidase [Candidatus Didemnitutus sp.]|nr:M3 family metallopeptidase [Candidatus Didemnitutus sp.]